jgi:hypothetical protein
MAKFEFVTQFNTDVKAIEAEDFIMDTATGKLVFTDKDNNNIAAYAIDKTAWVKRASAASGR